MCQGLNSHDFHIIGDGQRSPIPKKTRLLTMAQMLLASLGLIVAASGGIGGGGILVPLFMLVLERCRWSGVRMLIELRS